MMNDKVFMLPNPVTPGKAVEINPTLCIGCNNCVEVCRVDLFMPNPEKGKPPIVVYPDECWFAGCCIAHCPVPGAIIMEQPLNQRVGWKRKETGEFFRIGMLNAPPPYTKPPVG